MAYIERFIQANAYRLHYIKKEATEFVVSVAKHIPEERLVISFSGGKDSTATADVVVKALGNPRITHIFGDTTLEFPMTYEYATRFDENNPDTPVWISKNYDQDFYEVCEDIGPPARMMRWCCSMFKNRPYYGILFDGAWLWEEYINSLIEDVFYHPMNKGGKGAQRLFEGNVDLIYPDFISRNSEMRIIADAKYKPIDNIGNRDSGLFTGACLVTMNTNELIKQWKAEEEIAHIHGWDFSHIEGRYMEEDNLPWDYREAILRHLKSEMRILDIDTGGGEFLLSLNHPYENTAAMENYPPNVEFCKEVLLPLRIDFRAGDGKVKLPFDDGSFDMVINRHGDFNAEEIYRVLKPGGLFITQQVGAENDRELVTLLCGETEMPFPEQYLSITTRKFEDAGFIILRGEEVFRPIRFFDVGALVWFARIIQWEFPDFSVETHLEKLLHAQRILEEHGSVDGSIHRFLLVVRKEAL